MCEKHWSMCIVEYLVTFYSPHKSFLSLPDLLNTKYQMFVLFSCSVISDSLQPHGLQHAGLRCPSPSPRACSNSCPLSRWCHPTILFILCHPLLLCPSVLSSIRVFSNESVLHIRWLKYWSFSFSISPSNENSGLIFFRMDWLDLLAVQGTLESVLQHHSSKASILQRSAFFMVQLSHAYIIIETPIPLTIWTFVGRIVSDVALSSNNS